MMCAETNKSLTFDWFSLQVIFSGVEHFADKFVRVDDGNGLIQKRKTRHWCYHHEETLIYIKHTVVDLDGIFSIKANPKCK